MDGSAAKTWFILFFVVGTGTKTAKIRAVKGNVE
jgi:hypothetical protein